jgi:hypothetical protein
MAIIVLNESSFNSGEDFVLAGIVTDDAGELYSASTLAVDYVGQEYTVDVKDGSFSIPLNAIDEAGAYSVDLTAVVDGVAEAEAVTVEFSVVDPSAGETPPEEVLTEEELAAQIDELNDPSPDFVADYVPYSETDTENLVANEGSFQGIGKPIETDKVRFPERRRIDVTHPNPEINGVIGLTGYTKKTDMEDEASDSERHSVRGGGSAMGATGFTF